MRLREVVGLAALWISLGLLVPTPAQEKPAIPKPPGLYIPASRCDGANCHGKPAQAERPPFMQEYIAWSSRDENDFPYDRHAYATTRLKEDPASGQIMAALNGLEGTNDEAGTSERCVTCHGVSVHDYGWGKPIAGMAVALHKELRAPQFAPNEGISCDGCHGPAQKWLKPHEKVDWTLKEWNKLGGKNGGSLALYNQHGLYYSKDLVLWAEQCVRCHLRIDTNMLDAGHPDLIPFELFGHDESVPHWRDYSKEQPAPHLPAAGPSHAAVAWAVGQAVTLRQAAQQLLDRTQGTPHDKVDPGHIRNAIRRLGSHWIALRGGLATLDPAKVDPLEQAIGPILAEEKAAQPNCQALTAGAKAVLDLVQPLPRALADATVNRQQVEAILAALVADDAACADPVRGIVLMRSLYALNYARLCHANPAALEENPPTEAVMVALDEMWEDPDPAKQTFKEALLKIRAALAGN